MKDKIKWSVSDISKGTRLGILEVQDASEEYHVFEVVKTADRLVFGNSCNAGFLESGYILLDSYTVDECLEELIQDLLVYYNDGERYTSHIVCNERM